MYLAGWGRCITVMGIAVFLVILSAKVWAVPHLPDSDFIPRNKTKQRSERDRKKTWFPAVSICFCFMFRCLSPSVLSSGLLRRWLRWLRWWSLPGPGAPRPGLCYVMNVMSHKCEHHMSYVSHMLVITKHYINYIWTYEIIFVIFLWASWLHLEFFRSHTLWSAHQQTKKIKQKLSRGNWVTRSVTLRHATRDSTGDSCDSRHPSRLGTSPDATFRKTLMRLEGTIEAQPIITRANHPHEILMKSSLNLINQPGFMNLASTVKSLSHVTT